MEQKKPSKNILGTLCVHIAN